MKQETTARAALAVGALGVVFGDIGTSPIYTIQTVFNPCDPHPVSVGPSHVYGVISLIFWSVTTIVTVTYVPLVMRADNDGEGGIMALITLIRQRRHGKASHEDGAGRAGDLRGLAVLRRQHDHPGDIGAIRRGGTEGRAPSLGELVVPITAAIIIFLFLSSGSVRRRSEGCSGR